MSLHGGRDRATPAVTSGWDGTLAGDVTSLTRTGLWDDHLCSAGSGNEQEKGAELCNNPVVPGALTKQAGMQQALRSRALREGQSSSALRPAVPGMLGTGQGRAWKCSSTIQTCREVAQEQSRRLAENHGSSKNPLLFWAARTNTPERDWQALVSLMFTDKVSGLNPAIGKMGPFAPNGERDPSCIAALQ